MSWSALEFNCIMMCPNKNGIELNLFIFQVLEFKSNKKSSYSNELA